MGTADADKDLEIVDAVYAVTTNEISLREVALKYLKLQGDAGGAMFHYDSILEQAGKFEVVTTDPRMSEIAQGVFDNYARARGEVAPVR